LKEGKLVAYSTETVNVPVLLTTEENGIDCLPAAAVHSQRDELASDGIPATSKEASVADRVHWHKDAALERARAGPRTERSTNRWIEGVVDGK
jgi:L-fucose isomerase-like protein